MIFLLQNFLYQVTVYEQVKIKQKRHTQ